MKCHACGVHGGARQWGAVGGRLVAIVTEVVYEPFQGTRYPLDTKQEKVQVVLRKMALSTRVAPGRVAARLVGDGGAHQAPPPAIEVHPPRSTSAPKAAAAVVPV